MDIVFANPEIQEVYYNTEKLVKDKYPLTTYEDFCAQVNPNNYDLKVTALYNLYQRAYDKLINGFTKECELCTSFTDRLYEDYYNCYGKIYHWKVCVKCKLKYAVEQETIN